MLKSDRDPFYHFIYLYFEEFSDQRSFGLSTTSIFYHFLQLSMLFASLPSSCIKMLSRKLLGNNGRHFIEKIIKLSFINIWYIKIRGFGGVESIFEVNSWIRALWPARYQLQISSSGQLECFCMSYSKRRFLGA